MENYNKEIERNLYLRELLLGNIQGPLTGIPNIDRPWLKYYTKEEQFIVIYMMKIKNI